MVDKSLQIQVPKKIASLLALKKITVGDLAHFNDAELTQLRSHVNKLAAKLEGEALDELLTKLEPITCERTKNEYWERNHCLMVQEISKYVSSYGRMPAFRELETLTGLSRQTLTKHLKDYKKSELYNDQLEQFRFMNQKVLAKLLQFAINGNVKAAKLYLEINGLGVTPNRMENNFIQINNMIISQDKLKSLPEEQLIKIEEFMQNQLTHYQTCSVVA